jgi:hypothetical protein
MARPEMIKRFKRYGSALVVLYVLYLVKSAAGLDISSQYSAPDFLKRPIRGIMEAQAHNPHAFHRSIF